MPVREKSENITYLAMTARISRRGRDWAMDFIEGTMEDIMLLGVDFGKNS